MKKILLILLVVGMFASCDSFLDEAPTKTTAKTLETAEELDALFNDVYYSSKSNPDFYCTDNFDIPLGVYNEFPSAFTFEAIEQYLFATSIEGAKDACWDHHYNTVWLCNLALKVIAENSITGADDLKNQLKYEAHFIRATEYFALALNYCLHPGTSTESELGLPLRVGVDFEESLSRSSLKDTYEFIEADLQQALKMDVSLERNWRASTAAVEAFAARFYLYMGDFTKASQYATAALSEHSEMIDYDSEFYTVEDASGLAYPMTNSYPSYTSAWLNFWTGQYMNRSIFNPSWKTLPSQELLDLYDPLDKRYEIFMVENYLKRFGFETNQHVGYIQGGNYGECISGPSTSEMFLIRAETKARLGDISGAMADVEQVRINRFAASDYTALALPSDKKSAIQAVIDERRREMPFTIRWYDIRRLNVDSETDNITIRRKFYPLNGNQVNMDAAPIEYVIEPDSRLFARPLNSGVINLSEGQTVQNEY
ncbi:RagB/SusD family nutrient uptake outer membrane protein [Ancylomarina euxinus]|uniref:RagB/SusD family nutrient uptake outer membrane protein n=1 Tax=Ancylomarina euxinus TaxID=2283627 RepID=A0A425XZA0_9BACT|nr:RagB/SusD family nutrient uptake outer membrane protein [Ancylomarina euxinus]MCZ4695566.1 RagB/SusD family nutrient uptake outer membrane protein [Ancylomarina euxinus]MUP15947.1 RagB/SusD family nutrient uptake outer membrane protein [Ancylomarina euxinus]RRG20388.1 RagB/SusD family nutrient uptake outer membrane protein [Ancylomarina euxinus]